MAATRNKNTDKVVFIFLIAVIAILLLQNINIELEKMRVYNTRPPENIKVYDKIIDFNSLTLRQKIAQKLIVYGNPNEKEFYQNIGIGGLFIGATASKSGFNATTTHFQTNAKIPFFLSTDVEGCINTLQNFATFTYFSDIQSNDQAYQLGISQGETLKELGVQIDFSPVVDLRDTIWKCRSFPGTPKEISEKASSYITGLQSTGTMATAKHYPGRTLDVKDVHKSLAQSQITQNDLLPFEASINAGVKAIMMSHVIASGEVYSDEKPASSSRRAIDYLKTDYNGLIITDDVNMRGLNNYYEGNDKQMYIDLFAAGNDMILNVAANPEKINNIMDTIEVAVTNDEIPIEQIDNSVKKILRAKGYIILS